MTQSKEGKSVWSSDEEGHKRMIYPEEKQQGHKITISEHAYAALMNMVEDSHDKKLTEEAKNDDFSTLLTAILFEVSNNPVNILKSAIIGKTDINVSELLK